MKLVERSPFRAGEQSLTWVDRLRGIWNFGLAWDRDLRAQEALIGALASGLDHRYILLRNIMLPDLGLPVPLILIGPAGLKVICASALRGIYRARDQQWFVLRPQGKRYVPSRPNLVKRAMLMGRAVQETLLTRGYRLPDIEPVLFFADPGLHVETLEPAAQLVQLDGLDHFLTAILQSPAVMDSTEAQVVADAILRMEFSKGAAEPSRKAGLESKPARPSSRAGMKIWQWLVIGLLAAAALIVLTVMAAIMLGLLKLP